MLTFPQVRIPFKDSLGSYSKIAVFLLAITLPSLILAVDSVRIAAAAKLGDSEKVPQMKLAVSLDPENPNLHFRLGMAEIYNMEDSDPAQGIQQLQRASELDPYVTRYWTALAFACEFEGMKTRADHAISRSLALSPMVPEVRWKVGSFYLQTNRQGQALEQFRRLLEFDPLYARSVFRAALDATSSPEIVYRNVLKPSANPKLKITFINFLTSEGHENSAFDIWQDVAGSKSTFKFSVVDPYLEHLIRTRQLQRASAVWNDLESRDIVSLPADDNPANLVFNGGFEQAPLDAGFGWRYHEEPYVTIDFNDRQAYQGSSCLRIEFADVENHRDEPVYQFVPVTPDQNYELTAYVRSDNITSDSGPRLRVVDPVCPGCLSASSRPVVGTTPWHQLVLDFQTGPKTRLVRLSVWRPLSLGYPAEILGTLWMDQVFLKAVASLPAQATERPGV